MITYKKFFFIKITILVSLTFLTDLKAQVRFELTEGWKFKNVSEVLVDGTELSMPAYSLNEWKPATVPGTVLTSLLNNGEIPDPFYGMNNEKIPDIYHTGREHYTYWFIKDFNETVSHTNELLWLHLRGVNYSCEVYLNGKKLNDQIHKGMFLRQTYNITDLVKTTGTNRLAILVHPPDHVGNPNGGQGGDGVIAKNVGIQYSAGWDWIQPIRDRNTGIWDKVWIEKTGAVNLKNPHIITKVEGKRFPEDKQANAVIQASAELENPTGKKIKGVLQYELDGNIVKTNVTLSPNTSIKVSLPELSLKNPKLWWPHGYGQQHLYKVKMQFLVNGKELSDEENISVGIRELKEEWNPFTRSMEILVNGQKIFIKGGNWIISDAMLRFSPERYDAEIRFHRDMNLNLIRIWGGAITERPEFYEACDKYGLLVIQDFWMSGDCNGRWLDPYKLEDQWTRRKYPDDHSLFLESAADMVKMIRNHASLAMWCGGNEITPPEDILNGLKDDLLPQLDGTRSFITYSNSDSMSYNFIGGNGDGPYTIQPKERFWQEKTFPFNSEVGSVGVGDYESLERFVPAENMVPPKHPSPVDPVWQYHKYIEYEHHIAPYGNPESVKEFGEIAQLINYDQYRALSEGFTAHMWDWYTGYIIWKTQNPWTSLRGQMYDYYLDPNASLYALHHGNEPLHVMVNPVDGMIMVANHTLSPQRDIMLKVEAFDMDGKDSLINQVFVYIEPSSVKNIESFKKTIDGFSKEKGCFLRLQLLDLNKVVLSENFYWYPDSKGEYSGLQSFVPKNVQVEAVQVDKGKIKVSLRNEKGNPVSFFNRVSLVDPENKKRLLPVFYDDNYVSIPPGENKEVVLEFDMEFDKMPLISIKGWNAEERFIKIKSALANSNE